MNDRQKEQARDANNFGFILAIQSALVALIETHPEPEQLHAASRRACAAMLVHLQSSGADEKTLHAYADFYRYLFPKAGPWLPQTRLSLEIALRERQLGEVEGVVH